MPDRRADLASWRFSPEARDGQPLDDIVGAMSEDIPALVDLVNSCYRGDSSRRGWTSEADLLGGQRTDAESMSALLQSPDSAVLVLRASDGLRACCHVCRADERSAYLGMVSVRPNLQNMGLGRLLLEAAESYATLVLGVARIKMTVISLRTELIAWYARRGYLSTGQREEFPKSDPRFGIPKRADLDFIVLEKCR